MKQFVRNYPAFFQAAKPARVDLFGKQVEKDLWEKLYLRFDQDVFYLSVTPLLDDPDFDYIFCLELLRVAASENKQLGTEICSVENLPLVGAEYFSLSERLSGDDRQAIKQLSIRNSYRLVEVSPSYDRYFSCHVRITNNSGYLKPVS